MGKGLREMGLTFGRAVWGGEDLATPPAACGPEPWHLHPLAWEYMLPDRPMTRRVDTLEVHGTRWGLKRMEIDVSFPSRCQDRQGGTGTPARCLIPAAFIPKEPVAPDLEVRDESGTVQPVPTRKECMFLTDRAISQIATHAPGLLSHPDSEYRLDTELGHRINDVIFQEPLRARISRMWITQKLIPEGDKPLMRQWLVPLLNRLEESYLLWVPIEGSPLGDHRVSIKRSENRELDPIFPVLRKRRPEAVTVHSKAGDIKGRWHPPSRWKRSFDLPTLVGRLLVSCGLMPVKFEEEALEAHRFSSFHLCMAPPTGLKIREVKSGKIEESEKWAETAPPIDELKTDVDRTVQGEDTRTGHLHFEMRPNPSWLYNRITIGLRPGTTTLWAMVVVFTCVLLWGIHEDAPRLLGLEPGASKHPVQIQIAAAVLLIGPPIAASWTLREKDPAMVRSMLAGTQLLVLGSVILSVATALALGGIMPFGWKTATAIEWYASFSYTIATLIAIGWLQARVPVWVIYRRLLRRPALDLLATTGLALLACLSLKEFSDSSVLATVALFATGFSLTAIAGNRTSVRLGQVSLLSAAVAGVGAFITLALASFELGLYTNLAERGDFHAYGACLELGLAVVALGVLGYRAFVHLREQASSGKARKPSSRETELPSIT